MFEIGQDTHGFWIGLDTYCLLKLKLTPVRFQFTLIKTMEWFTGFTGIVLQLRKEIFVILANILTRC